MLCVVFVFVVFSAWCVFDLIFDGFGFCIYV